MITELYNLLKKYAANYHPVVPFDVKKDKLLKLDFTEANSELTDDLLTDTDAFIAYIKKSLGKKYTYGIGGYDEHRTIYARSSRFNNDEEPRRLHLGIDIWGKWVHPFLPRLAATFTALLSIITSVIMVQPLFYNTR